MLDINLLKKTGYFETKVLKKGEVLFDEGDFDHNIYIIITGELAIEKYTSKEKKETKNLAILKKDDIFGEAALNTDKKKEVKILANKKTQLIYIDTKIGLKNLFIKYPKQGLNILKYIIYLSNKRLSQSNYLITANYKISKEIRSIKDINNKSLFGLIQKLKNIIMVDHIIYLEENPVMKNYITVKYDTREQGKMLDKVIEVNDAKMYILELKINNYFTDVQKLCLGENDLGKLVFFRKKKDFNDNDKKVLLSASTAIAGLIKQKIVLEEEKNRESLDGEVY